LFAAGAGRVLSRGRSPNAFLDSAPKFRCWLAAPKGRGQARRELLFRRKPAGAGGTRRQVLLDGETGFRVEFRIQVRSGQGLDFVAVHEGLTFDEVGVIW
jgi:hypothetical protein